MKFGSSGKELACKQRRCEFHIGSGEISRREEMVAHSSIPCRKSLRQRSLEDGESVGWVAESNTTLAIKQKQKALGLGRELNICQS